MIGCKAVVLHFYRNRIFAGAGTTETHHLLPLTSLSRLRPQKQIPVCGFRGLLFVFTVPPQHSVFATRSCQPLASTRIELLDTDYVSRSTSIIPYSSIPVRHQHIY
jgi:hypothetical protein